MGQLHLITKTLDTTSYAMKSEWGCFLLDPITLDVALCFARHVYAVRLQHHAYQLTAAAYKGKALRSVRKRLNDGSKGLSDSLVAAIIILTILDVCLTTNRKNPE